MGKKKTNPNKIPASKADVDKAKQTARDHAIMDSLTMFFTALRDKEGMSVEDLQRIYREIDDAAVSIQGGYANFTDLRNVLRDESDIRFDFVVEKVRRK